MTARPILIVDNGMSSRNVLILQMAQGSEFVLNEAITAEHAEVLIRDQAARYDALVLNEDLPDRKE